MAEHLSNSLQRHSIIVTVRSAGMTEQVWVPLTEIRYGTEVAQIGHRGRLVVSRWFAQNLGLS